MRLPALAIAVLAGPGLAGPGLAQELDSKQWVYFDSLETAAPPRLRVELEGGETREVRAEADTVLIGYIAGSAFSGLPSLSVNLADTNRVLLRFPVEAGWEVGRATLALSTHPSQIPPPAPFEVAIRAVAEEWDEVHVCWNDQPAFAEEALVAMLGVDEHLFEPDVTELVRAWASGERENFGLAIHVSEPLGPAPPTPTGEPAVSAGGGPPPAPPPLSPLEEALLGIYGWAPTPAVAVSNADDEGRHVLALVTGDFGRNALNSQEKALLATCLAHPDVRRTVVRELVPVRVVVSPNEYAMAASGSPPSPDPLAALGTTLVEAKPPALVVTRGDGTHVATLASLGTHDHELVLGFLRGALGAEPETRILEGRDARVAEGVRLLRRGDREQAADLLAANLGDPRAAYWLAALRDREGDGERAKQLLLVAENLDPDSPWAHKARMRRELPDLVRALEPLERPAVDASTEEEVVIARALEYLVDAQEVDGSWPLADPLQEGARAGVTVLGLHALLTFWSPGDRREELLEPMERAMDWCSSNVELVDPETLNSFAASYFLDMLLGLAETADEQHADLGTDAVPLLLGGQMENGAWSYDKRWGEAWTGGFGGWPVTDKGRAHSMNTGIAMEVLTRAKAMGKPVDDEALERGAEALLAMRRGPGAYTYTWPDPDIYGTPDASIARGPAAELALFRLRKVEEEDVRTAVAEFMARREELWVGAKLTGSWLPPHAYSGYFPLFGYYHAARVIRELGGETMRRDLAKLRADVLARVDPDGTWTDFPELGKPYGTAMALLILDLTRP